MNLIWTQIIYLSLQIDSNSMILNIHILRWLLPKSCFLQGLLQVGAVSVDEVVKGFPVEVVEEVVDFLNKHLQGRNVIFRTQQLLFPLDLGKRPHLFNTFELAGVHWNGQRNEHLGNLISRNKRGMRSVSVV